MTATCTSHSACVAQTTQASHPPQSARPTQSAGVWTRLTAHLRVHARWFAHLFAGQAITSDKPFAQEDSQWRSAIKSLEDLDETTLKDIGAPSWVVSEIERNRQSAVRRTLRIPHI